MHTPTANDHLSLEYLHRLVEQEKQALNASAAWPRWEGDPSRDIASICVEFLGIDVEKAVEFAEHLRADIGATFRAELGAYLDALLARERMRLLEGRKP